MTQFIERPKDLQKCADQIRSAQQVQQKHFVSFINAIGEQLEKAQRLLADHHAGFGHWVKDEFGWSHQQANSLIRASATMRLLETTVSTKNLPLPDSERQCRPLSAIPKEHVAAAWERACESCTQPGSPPTEAVVRSACEPFRTAKQTKASKVRKQRSGDVTEPDQMLDEISFYAVSFLSDFPDRAGDLEVLLLTWVSRCKQR
jgi:hypothetical protein